MHIFRWARKAVAVERDVIWTGRMIAVGGGRGSEANVVINVIDDSSFISFVVVVVVVVVIVGRDIIIVVVEFKMRGRFIKR